MGESNESIRIAHLTMIQGVISRMGANSFALKALSATFGSAAIAVLVSTETPSPLYAIAATVPIMMFWLMDAQYLRLERAYRELFEHVRLGKKIEAYNLKADSFMDARLGLLRTAASWSICWFYLAVLASLGIIAWLIICGQINDITTNSNP